jgi:outer membrane protein
MYRNVSVLLISLFLVLFFTGPLLALSLEEAKEEALRENLDIKIADEEVVEAGLNMDMRYSELFAKLRAIASGTYVDKEPGTDIKVGEYGTFPFGPMPAEDITVARGDNEKYNFTLQLEQPLFTGGRIYYSYLGAETHKALTEWDNKQIRQDILVSVEQAYITILKAEETIKVAEKHERTVENHLKDIEMKYEHGRVSLNDVLAVKVEVAWAGQRVMKAKNSYILSIGRLNFILDRPIDQFVEVVPLEDPLPILSTLKSAREIALINRPDINSVRSENEETRLKRQVAESDYYPDISFVAEYIRQTEEPSTEPENWRAMVLMEYPLWEWGVTGHKVDAARAVVRRAKYKLNSLESRIIAEVGEAWLMIEEADKSIEVTNEVMLHAKENLRIVNLGFDHGAKTSTDVLDAEKLLNEAESDHVTSKYEAQFARTMLRYRTGMMETEGLAAKSKEQ